MNIQRAQQLYHPAFFDNCGTALLIIAALSTSACYTFASRYGSRGHTRFERMHSAHAGIHH
eukprot:17100-Heterococcus_DN1.PRE.2